MKKKLLLLLLLCIFTTGCFKRDNMEGINIITTYYPIEYVTSILYGEHSVVNSIYPDGTNVYEYELNNKQLKDHSKKDLFIYLGLTNDSDIAISLLNRNNKLLIIDGTFGMETKYGIEELWLNPSNLLMISQNIKNGLEEYIDSAYLNKEIDEHYEDLKVLLSELDAEIKLTAQNAKNKTLVVSNDVFKFLEKYGFNIISLDPDTVTEKTINLAKEELSKKSNKYIFVLENEKLSEDIETFKQTTSSTFLTFKNITNITDEERNNRDDYIKIMNENLELIKKDAY